MSVKINFDNPIVQSPYMYMQAAGSTGDDGSSKGIHLRWDFRRILGNEHFAKGHLAESDNTYPVSTGFNKKDDFIRLYRVEYNQKFEVKLDLSVSPSSIVDNSAEKVWNYAGFIPVSFDSANNTDVKVEFMDHAEYDTLKASINPSTQPLQFVIAYQGVIQVSAVDKLKFKGEFELGVSDPDLIESASFKVESVTSIHDKYDQPDNQYVSARKTMTDTDPLNDRTIICENIELFRFTCDNFFPKTITLATYHDHILGENDRRESSGNWEYLGEFSLDDGFSDSNNGVFKRLEDTSRFNVDRRWPKYNETNTSSGEFCVKVSNYQDKWTVNEGLQDAVKRYLTLSQSDPRAVDSITSDQAPDDGSMLTVSYHDMLNIVGLDFHVGRMLGLGTIDVPFEPRQEGETTTQVIYVVEYFTEVAFENVSNDPTSHLFMSLPTAYINERLPSKPQLKPITYGLDINEVQPNAAPLTDTNGYSLFENVRFVNIQREDFRHEIPFGPFFWDSMEFCSCSTSVPVQYGLEYKLSTEANFVKPELAHDPNYRDHSSMPETLGIPETGRDVLYVHEERDEGQHDYGLYSINWFSRISDVSPLVSTDVTQFPNRCLLLPPANFAVQLIQEESPLLFSTSDEQTALGDITGTDKTLVRATFDWNFMHNDSYQFADRAELFFKKAQPLVVQGEITSVTDITGSDNLVSVQTGPFTITSTATPTTLQPDIATGDVSKFIGSRLVTQDNAFVIEAITSAGANPTITLKKVRETASMDPSGNNVLSTVEMFEAPTNNSKFLIVENLNEDANWDTNIVKTVYLENFHTVYNCEIEGSSNSSNNGIYTVKSVGFSAGNTSVIVHEIIPDDAPTTLGDFLFSKKCRVLAVSGSVVTVSGDITGELSVGNNVSVVASHSSDGLYTVASVTLNGSNTDVDLTGFSDTTSSMYMSFKKSIPITAIDGGVGEIIMTGNYTDEIVAVYQELLLNEDGSDGRNVIVGGVLATATINDVEDRYQPGDPGIANPPNVGEIKPGSKTGVYTITFDNYQLPNHIDPEVEWYRGTVRVLEDGAFLPAPQHDPSTPNLTVPRMKVLDVWSIDTTGSTLVLTVFDPTFNVNFDVNSNPTGDYLPNVNSDYVPIKTGSSIEVNFHPSYRTYFKAQTGSDFIATNILPEAGKGSKQTFMGIRSSDTKEMDCKSSITPPVPLLAQELVSPSAPGEPTGPVFATRPDFYGKSTYTFDVEVDTTGGRKPYALVFYRANERSVLDTLYKPQTVADILNTLYYIGPPEDYYVNDRWNDLVNVNVDTAVGVFENHFKAYIADGYRFPIPDNDKYQIPNPDPSATPVYPFDGVTPPGLMIETVKDAIDGSFLPLTEQPVIYNYLNSGTQTSGKKPVIRDENGDILSSNDLKFDPFPMATKHNNGSADLVRFTDYTLDGSSNNFYFYFGVELSNQLKVSERSGIVGPIQLTDNAPAEQPVVRQVIVKQEDVLNELPARIEFKINDYLEAQKISKIEIYRAFAKEDAQSIRTMTLAKSIEVADVLPIEDDFSDLEFAPFGEPIFYRLVAIKEIVNEHFEREEVPSIPSNIALTNIIDVRKPKPPVLSYTSGVTDPSSTVEFTDVNLSWGRVGHNCTYYLEHMDIQGNWTKIYDLKSNDLEMNVNLIDTDLNTANILKEDEFGNTIVSRFRIRVENSSGIVSTENKALTI